MPPLLTRFAPSPTGHLHLGHVIHALHVWGVAAARGGQVLLRVEDHDRQRSRPEFEASILEDLDWLGLVPAGPVIRQSDRGGIYQAHLDRLKENGLVYACSCSRKDMARTAPDIPGEELCYPGTCRGLGLEWEQGLSLRIVLPPERLVFQDARLGIQRQVPSLQCGDLQAVDRRGNWTYQFAVTVDDLVQGVNLVIRGEDLLPSTGRQILLARLLGRREPPQFLHHPLVKKLTGQKLSKAQRDTGIRQLRARGETVELVLGRAMHAGGLVDRVAELSLADALAIVRQELPGD